MKRSKSVPYGTNEIVIPELEEAMKTYTPKNEWTDFQIAAVKKYYGKVPTAQLASSIKRSVGAVHKYAELHGLNTKQKTSNG